MAEVSWTRRALSQLQAIVDRIAEERPERTDALAERIMAAPDLLETSPRLGRRVPELGLDHVRELVTVRPYRIMYLLRDDHCHIVALLHSRQDFHRHLNRQRLEDID